MTEEPPHYHCTGFGTAGPGTVTVQPEGRELDSGYDNPDLPSHSSDGFQAGYAGSGPAQLAAALLYDATGDAETANEFYQQFKEEEIEPIPDDQDEFTFTKGYVVEWVQKARREE